MQQQCHSLRTADAFPFVASLPPKGGKRRPEMRPLFAGYNATAGSTGRHVSNIKRGNTSI